MKNLIIIGASGFGREVAWLVERINKESLSWNLLGFIDDDPGKSGKTINGYEVLGNTDSINNYANSFFVCAIGSSKIRKTIIDTLQKQYSGIKFATLIDPSVEMSDFVSIGDGSIICAHTLITVNVSIGANVIINLDCTIGHDAVLDDFVTLYPSVNISGNCKVGQCSEIGTGAQIIQGKYIGSNTIVGAGAVVIDDIKGDCSAVGVPSKIIKKDI